MFIASSEVVSRDNFVEERGDPQEDIASQTPMDRSGRNTKPFIATKIPAAAYQHSSPASRLIHTS
jgi:hypothetical protein